MSEDCRCVSYSAFIRVVSALLVAGLTILGVAFAWHKEQPHVGAVTDVRLLEVMQLVESRLGRIERQLDRLLE
jgi:hypothetical protein|tara:strand:+ start:102 stop:320 length:219 start_codon:yes stop_codon:yes gene_type:complete